MANKDFVSNWESTLNQIQKALEAKAVAFSTKAWIAVDLLEVSLESLAVLGLLSKVSVEVSGSTSEGKHIVRKYMLGRKEAEDEEGYVDEVPCIKKSVLEEDE